ncbi:MAG: hypothetical protein K0R46_2527 [Herbinix sp.]|jgi:hypothetical protein|nr:hypothetical protein [Herbinix sp.]
MADKKKGFPTKLVKKYIDLLYMTPQEINAKEIADLLQENKGLTIELWAEMNVLEFVLPNQNSVDFEAIDPDFKTPSDAAFVKNRGIKSVYSINLCEDDLSIVTPYFEQLVEKFSGFVCADSEDFTPVYAGSSKK